MLCKTDSGKKVVPWNRLAGMTDVIIGQATHDQEKPRYKDNCLTHLTCRAYTKFLTQTILRPPWSCGAITGCTNFRFPFPKKINTQFLNQINLSGWNKSSIQYMNKKWDHKCFQD